MNDTTENRKQRLAKLANLAEANGWARRPDRQASLERLRASMTVIHEETQAPEPAKDDAYDDAEWRRELAHLQEYSFHDYESVVSRWEKRCIRAGLDMPVHEDVFGRNTGVAYAAECRRRYLVFRREHKRSLAYGCEVLAEIGLGFHRLQPLLDHHHVGEATLAQIQRLYEALVDEVAMARNE